MGRIRAIRLRASALSALGCSNSRHTVLEAGLYTYAAIVPLSASSPTKTAYWVGMSLMVGYMGS